MAFSAIPSDDLPSNALVLDNSVMMRWVFKDGSEKDQVKASDILRRIKDEDMQVFVPYLWIYESAFVVNFYTKNGDIELDEGARHLAALFDLCHVVRGEEQPIDLYQFSSQHGLSAYDSSYLMLAQQLSCPIATLDKKLIRISERINQRILA